MPPILWRILFAILAVVLVYALIPPVARVLGVAISADVFTILRICIAGLAIYYIFGHASPPRSA